MPFHITPICFNEPDYVVLHSVVNIMAEKRTKMTKNGAIMVLVINIWYMSEKVIRDIPQQML